MSEKAFQQLERLERDNPTLIANARNYMRENPNATKKILDSIGYREVMGVAGDLETLTAYFSQLNGIIPQETQEKSTPTLKPSSGVLKRQPRDQQPKKRRRKMDEKITRNIEEYALENTEEVRNARNYLLRGQQVDEESFRKAGYEKLLELAQGSLNAVKKVLKVNGEKTALVQRRKRARAYTELEERVITEIAEHFKTNREVVGLDTEFVNDLGAESLDTIELQFDYEEWYDLPEKEDLWEDIVSVADLVQTIIKYGKYKKEPTL